MKVLACIYYIFSLIYTFIVYDKDEIKFMYDIGLLGTDEGRILRKVFRK